MAFPEEAAAAADASSPGIIKTTSTCFSETPFCGSIKGGNFARKSLQEHLISMLAELNNLKMSAASDDINSLYSTNTLITPPLSLLSDSTALGVFPLRLESVGRRDSGCEERPFQGFQDLKDAQSFHFYKQVDQFSNCSSDRLCGMSQVLPSGAPISAGPEMGTHNMFARKGHVAMVIRKMRGRWCFGLKS